MSVTHRRSRSLSMDSMDSIPMGMYPSTSKRDRTQAKTDKFAHSSGSMTPPPLQTNLDSKRIDVQHAPSNDGTRRAHDQFRARVGGVEMHTDEPTDVETDPDTMIISGDEPTEEPQTFLIAGPGFVHGTPVFAFSLGEGKAGRTIEIDEEERAEKVKNEFTTLKDILHEKRPIDYNITQNYINAYQGEDVTRYVLTDNVDVTRLLVDNKVIKVISVDDVTTIQLEIEGELVSINGNSLGLTPEELRIIGSEDPRDLLKLPKVLLKLPKVLLKIPAVKKKVDEVNQRLDAVNKTMRTETKQETGTDKQIWIRDSMGVLNGVNLSTSGIKTVDNLLRENNHRTKYLKKAFADTNRRLVREHGGLKVLTDEGADALQEMHEAEALRKAAYNYLTDQQRYRKTRIDQLKGQPLDPLEGNAEEIALLEREWSQLEEAKNELLGVSAMAIDWTLMQLEGTMQFSGGRKARGDDLRKHRDNCYLHMLAKKSARDLEDLVSEAHVNRESKVLGYFGGKPHPLDRAEKAAVARAASLVYHVEDSHQDPQRPMKIDLLMFLQNKMTRPPLAETFLLRNALAMSKGGNFDMHGFGSKIPPRVDPNGMRVFAALDGGRPVQEGNVRVLKEDGSRIQRDQMRAKKDNGDYVAIDRLNRDRFVRVGSDGKPSYLTFADKMKEHVDQRKAAIRRGRNGRPDFVYEPDMDINQLTILCGPSRFSQRLEPPAA